MPAYLYISTLRCSKFTSKVLLTGTNFFKLYRLVRDETTNTS